jgi:D-threo-aldose 1-dehydrogenase
MVDRSWQAGIRFFDTAPLYGNGLAEQRLGKVLRERIRGDFTLATKVGRLLRADAPSEPGQVFRGAPPMNPVFDFSYDGVMRSFEESLIRLGMERIDVLHIHDPDNHFNQALEGAYRALDSLRDDGLISAVGAGMNQVEMLSRFAREADFDCFLLAGRYTLLDQSGGDELLPLCLERGIAIIAGGVYNSGILADPTPGTHYNYQPASAELLDRAQRIGVVCSRHSVPLKAAAIQFPFGHPAVNSVVIGCRSAAEVEENVRMFETPIPSQLWEELKAERLLPAEARVP